MTSKWAGMRLYGTESLKDTYDEPYNKKVTATELGQNMISDISENSEVGFSSGSFHSTSA